MKKRLFSICALITAILFLVSGCSIFDKDYGTSTVKENVSSKRANIKIPEIKSEDEVMPTYFDISLYDEENYADIYLGNDYCYKVTYSGSAINVPTSYKDMIKAGFKFLETEEIRPDSKIMAGKSLKVSFENQYGKQIIAVFYNKTNSLKKLNSCPIVKFLVEENSLYNSESVYGQFWINGVSNESAITDVIECLGQPSHFYAVDNDNYYLDYFLTEKDKRSKITVYINVANDCVTGVEFSLY